VVELADGLVVNKADGDSKAAAERTRNDYHRALELLRPATPTWTPRVLTASALRGEGIPQVWDMLTEHRGLMERTGELEERRRDQARAWMWSLVDDGLHEAFRAHPGVAERLPALEAEVEDLRITPYAAARTLLRLFSGGG